MINVEQVTRNITVSSQTRDMRVNQVSREIEVKTVGRRGPQGVNGIINHGAVAGTARPLTDTPVIWIGTVEPTNAVDYDLWIDVS